MNAITASRHAQELLHHLAESINSFEAPPGARDSARIIRTWLVGVRDEETLDCNYPIDARSRAEARAIVTASRQGMRTVNCDWGHTLLNREVLWSTLTGRSATILTWSWC